VRSEALTKWLRKCHRGTRVHIVIAIRATNQLVSHMSQPSTENCSTSGHLQNGNSRQYLHFLLSYIPRREKRPSGGETCLFTHIYVYMLAMYKQEAISFDISRSIIFFRQSVNRQKRQFQLGQKKLKIDSRGRWRGKCGAGKTTN